MQKRPKTWAFREDHRRFWDNMTTVGITGGEGGIRTPGTVTRTPHFECGAIDHSATSPQKRMTTLVDGGGHSEAEAPCQPPS